LLAGAMFVAINLEYFAFSTRLEFPRVLQFSLVSALLPVAYILYGWSGFSGAVVLGAVLLFLIALEIVEGSRHEVDANRLVSAMCVGFCYVGIIGSIPVIVSAGAEAERVFWLLAGVICADTCAYFGGSFFKGPKLAPRVSPNKTVSGAVSGVLGAVLGSVLAGRLLAFSTGWAGLIFYGLLVGVLAIFGDLIESSVKRVFGVKDSGTLLPGHGGVLDRVDAIVFASCVLFLPVC